MASHSHACTLVIACSSFNNYLDRSNTPFIVSLKYIFTNR